MVAAVPAVPQLRKTLKNKAPSLAFERALWDAGADVVVGIDEVGRGAWAGPLTLVAAVVPRDKRVNKIRDSKMLNEREREALFDRVALWCRAWSVGEASAAECDQLGMSGAQKLAAQRALDGLGLPIDEVLVDGNWDFVERGNTHTIVKGDAKCLSIAAASILAKVTRDRQMRLAGESMPGYDFEFNKGYPCPRHQAALRLIGPSTIHRRSWSYMDNLAWTGVPRVRPATAQGSLF